MIITVTFCQHPSLYIKIQNTEVGCRYFNLIKSNYHKDKPIFRDELKYTTEYMIELAHQARKIFNWKWPVVPDFSQGIAPYLHKDLETLLKNGFSQIPEEYDELVHELHYCLHLTQHKLHNNSRSSWFQIEWYNDEGFELDPEFKFSLKLNKGDVRLQNPFVGHGPLQMWHEQDFINISQTCKFHTFVKPGMNIIHSASRPFTKFDQLIEKFQQHDPNFVEYHGVDKIKHYTGHPVIGKVINTDDLEAIKNSATLLTLKELNFYE